MAPKNKRQPGKKITAKQRRMRKRRMMIYLVVFLLFVILSSIVYALRQPQLRINSLSVRGSEMVDAVDLSGTAQDIIDGDYYMLIPRDSIIFYPKNKIKADVLLKFPEIREVDVYLDTWHDVVVEITERENEYFLESKSVLYEMDSQGVLFRQSDKTVSDQDKIFQSHVYDHTEVLLGEKMRGMDSLRKFSEFIDELAVYGIEVGKVRFHNTLVIILETRTGEKIIISPLDDYQSVVQTLNEVLVYKEFGFIKRKKEFVKQVDYINLRYGSKIFYCYIGDECEGNYDF